MIKNTILVACLTVFGLKKVAAQQYGGMWIPTEINEKEMKAMGMKISAQDIFHPTKPSIKDAIVHFNKGCTGEIISPQGLLLTNHHCGDEQIQSHSTPENDLLTNGFWAKDRAGELPNPNLTADFVVDIREVTPMIHLPAAYTPQQEAEVLRQKANELKREWNLKKYQDVLIRPMFAGNKYYAFVIESYKDVRLVGAPPQSIGKFGSDTDNWVWPRHTGDFSLFRIYAGPDNTPADYSPANVPLKSKYFLPISVRDLKEGDFTFVFGFPGRTNEYLPSIAIQNIINEINPARIGMRDIALKILDKKMRTDTKTRLQYASKYTSVANYWKKWIGETKGLKKANAVEKKRAYEQKLIHLNPSIRPVLQQLEALYTEQAPFALNNTYYMELMRNAETLYLARMFHTYVEGLNSGKISNEETKNFQNNLAETLKDYDAELDAQVTARLLHLYATKSEPRFLPQSLKAYQNLDFAIAEVEKLSSQSLITGRGQHNGKTIHLNLEEILSNPKDLALYLKKDPLLQLYSDLRQAYIQTTDTEFTRLQKQIDALQKQYLALQIQTDKERQFFPDANSTLRVTYGKVQGSNPSDAIEYHYQTTLDGVMEKYIPGDYEFDVPQRLIQLYNQKDYGPYANAMGKVPLAFTATNHTTGGNSGSPALDANGNLIGLNFDRQWEGTMSDIYYDANLCRNIMLDTKYILFIIDKFADAKWLLNEIKLVK